MQLCTSKCLTTTFPPTPTTLEGGPSAASKPTPPSLCLLTLDPTGLGNSPNGKPTRDGCPLSRLSLRGREGTGSGYETGPALHGETRPFPRPWGTFPPSDRRLTSRTFLCPPRAQDESAALWSQGRLPLFGVKRAQPHGSVPRVHWPHLPVSSAVFFTLVPQLSSV